MQQKYKNFCKINQIYTVKNIKKQAVYGKGSKEISGNYIINFDYLKNTKICKIQ